MSHYGLYRGVCTRNNDPENRLRIRLKVPAVSGPKETGWALPCVPPGWKGGELLASHQGGDHTHTHSILNETPNPGDAVWVMYEQGELDSPVWMGVF